MPYITFGLCHRKPPPPKEKVGEVSRNGVDAAGKETSPDKHDGSLARDGKLLALDEKLLKLNDESPGGDEITHGTDGQAQISEGEYSQKNDKITDKDNESLQKYNALLKYYEKKTIHGTRSLDQFFYNSVSDTDMDDRDQNQVFTRSFFDARNGDGVHEDHKTWPFLAVDQLWLWVIDEGMFH